MAVATEKIIIEIKPEEKDAFSNIVSQFASRIGSAPSSDRSSAAGINQSKSKPYSPYLSDEALSSKKVDIIGAKQEQEPISVSEPVVPDVELKVFKHKEVNALIRNRILSLENSVVSKTVEKKPLQEVDKTIKAVIQVEAQSDEFTMEQMKTPKQDEFVPTSVIGQLAKSMHRPKLEIDIAPLSPRESDEDKPIMTKAILKTPEPTVTKPMLVKQYSFDMSRKFHEETDDDGWKKVEEISSAESSSESDEESESSEQEVVSLASSDPENKSVVNILDSNKSRTYQSDESSELSDDSYIPQKKATSSHSKSSEKEVKMFSPDIVKRILSYNSYRETIETSMFEGFEDYIRRRNKERGVDPDLAPSESNYDSETYSEYSEFTNAGENDSFVDHDFSRKDRQYDTVSDVTDYTYRNSSNNSKYYSESVFDEGSVYSQSEGYSAYYTDDDNRTLMDETEFTEDERYYDDYRQPNMRYREPYDEDQPSYDEHSGTSDNSQYPYEDKRTPYREYPTQRPIRDRDISPYR